MKKNGYVGVNIQWPISRSILDGKKSIETRTYPLPSKYINVPLILVETPGRKKEFHARGVAIITFGRSFEYKSKKDFYEDVRNHLVSKDSPWAWKSKSKWGWPILSIKKIDPIEIKNRGIIFRSGIQLKKP